MKKILLFVLMLFIISPLKSAENDGFNEIILKETSNKDELFKYWQDYIPSENKDNVIYRYYETPYAKGGESMIFTQIFDINACGANNCPYKVILKKSDGTAKEVLYGIGPDIENVFKIKNNYIKPFDINVGDLYFKYNESEEKYVKE
ncbi:MAG: hypothetical protein BWY78_00553 [Alphaproteobacteria bacterium ADurb.Bin438]|nr:MAG: hypothetical protein BWY78_00553 [Alphaproteobacteria bacterium ADurb.Bin438]